MGSRVDYIEIAIRDWCGGGRRPILTDAEIVDLAYFIAQHLKGVG